MVEIVLVNTNPLLLRDGRYIYSVGIGECWY
jgi:hypothetical protein